MICYHQILNQPPMSHLDIKIICELFRSIYKHSMDIELIGPNVWICISVAQCIETSAIMQSNMKIYRLLRQNNFIK